MNLDLLRRASTRDAQAHAGRGHRTVGTQEPWNLLADELP